MFKQNPKYAKERSFFEESPAPKRAETDDWPRLYPILTLLWLLLFSYALL